MRNARHQWIVILGAAIFGSVAGLSLPSAEASTVDDAIAALQWCWSDTNEPGHDSDEYLTTLPDGKRRGPETAHNLLVQARAFEEKGKDDMAVDMAAACQGHKPDQKAAIEEHMPEVLAWLKAHKE